MSEPPARLRLYIALGVVLYALSWAVELVKGTRDFVTSDGRLYYVYLPSLVIDGDLDFRNQMREHWGRDECYLLREQLTARGLIPNKYPIGLALSLTPSFLLAHSLSVPLHALTGSPRFAPDGYSLLYQGFNLLLLQVLGVAALWLADRLATEAFGLDPAATAAAVLTYWFGSNFAYYFFREPFMAHMCGAFWVNAVLWNAWRVIEELRSGWLAPRRAFLLTFCAAMALVCRPSNIIVAPVLAYAAARALVSLRPVEILKALPATAAGLAPLGAQMAIWYFLYGSIIHYSYSEEGFLWLHPAVLQSLFSSRHGLFFWSPLLLIGLAGFAGLLASRARREPLLWCLLVSAVALGYLNSCWYCWWFGHSFGGRAYVELNCVFILGLAAAFTAARRFRPTARWVLAGAVSGAVVYSLVMMGLYILHVLPHDGYLL